MRSGHGPIKTPGRSSDGTGSKQTAARSSSGAMSGIEGSSIYAAAPVLMLQASAPASTKKSIPEECSRVDR